MVPEQLMDHPIAEFMHKNCFTEQTGPVKVYYHRNDFPIGMHSHSFYEINIVDRGTGRHYIESHSCAASAGCVFVLPPEIRHGYWETSGLSIFHILLSCTYMERWQEELRALPGYPTLFEIEPMLRQERRDNLFLTLDSARLAGLIPELDALLELEHSTYPGASAIKCARTFALIGTLCQAVSAQYSAALQKPQQASAVLMQSMIKAKNGLHTVSVSSVVLCEYANHSVKYTLTTGEKIETMTIKGSFAEHIAPLLVDRRFIQPHSAFLINMCRVEKLSRDGITMHGGAFVPVSGKLFSNVKRAYIDYRLKDGSTV